MSSAPTTPNISTPTMNINIRELADRSSSTLDQLPESPSISVSAVSAPDTNMDDDYYEDIVSRMAVINPEASNHSSPTLQNSKSMIHSKTKRKKTRRHKKNKSLSLTKSEEGINKNKLKVKPLKKGSKSVAFEEKQKKKKVRHKKRRSLTPNHTPQKDLDKRLGFVNQYLLPVPRKQYDYKWAVLDPSDLKIKCKEYGNTQQLLSSLNANIEGSTANIALIQSNDLLICVCNMSSTAPIAARTHCRHSIDIIKKYFQTVCNMQIPIDIGSYEGGLDKVSLSHLLSSKREQKFLKQQKSRSNNRIEKHRRKNKTTKTLNNRWDLDTTHKETNKRIHRLHADNDDINWAIFHFKDNKHKKNTKWLIIADNEYGSGGSSALSDKLADIDEMRYAVLVVVHGHIVKKRYTLLIIWNPMNSKKRKQNRIERAHSHHSHTNTITFWNHKEKIKAFAGAIKEMNINLHSKLAESMIISSLHRDGLIDDIIIRVTHTQCNKRSESNPVEPTAVPRQWTLRELKSKLSRDCGIPIDKIRISLVPNIVKRERRRARTKSEIKIKYLSDDNKTLFDLDIDHGSQIYIHDTSNHIHDLNTSNSTIKRDRLRALQYLFNDNSNRNTHHHNHRREQSMPNVIIKRFAENIIDATKYNKIRTPKQTLSYQNINKKKKKRKNKKKRRNSKKKEVDYSSLLLPKQIANASISVGFLPKIRESFTSSTPTNQLHKGLLPLSKSWSVPKHVQNDLDQSVSMTTTDEDFESPSPRKEKEEQQAPPPLPAPLPLHLIGGTVVNQPTPPPLLIGNKKKLKTHLDELILYNSDENEKEDENEEELRPSSIFIDLELEIERKKTEHKAATPESFSITDDEEEVIPLPDFTVSNLVQTESNLNLNDIFITSHNVGRGKTASVHQALYKDTVFVAVKEFVFQNLSSAILADFHKEANTLKSLRHPNIAMLVGSYLDEVSGELYIVLEWLPGGCLHDLLHNNQSINPFDITYYDVLLMAIDIARGMKYLHEQNIIHRDLKTHNLLLDEEYRVKVTDFGTAKHLEQVKSKAFTEVGTLGYVAPEVLDPPINGYDGKIDVFSYAVILWEIYSSHASNNTDNVLTTVSTLQYAKRLKNGFRPKIPNDCPNDFKFLIDQCWQYKPQTRPTFHQIVLYLEKIMKKYQIENNYDDDDDDDDNDLSYSDDNDDDDEYEEYEESEEYEEDEESQESQDDNHNDSPPIPT